MDTSMLEELGLTNAEAKIYLALLKEGQSKTGRIIDVTKMQSSTVYHVLGSLIEKGLVSYVMIGKVKHYKAESPESLILFLEEKKHRFEDVLPQLRDIERMSEHKQTAKVYEGIKGLRAAYNDVLLTMKKGEWYRFFQVPKEKLYDEEVIRFFRNWHTRRSKKGVNVMGLCPTAMKRVIIERIFKGLTHSKLRFTAEVLPTGMVIYANKTMIIDWEEQPVTFVIESKAVAESYRKFFDEKWKTAKP